jgi:hypothetical protein
MTEEYVLRLAERAAEAVRELNHRTRDPGVFTGPAELYRLVGELALVAGRFPQLLDQLDRWLSAEHDAGRVRVDIGGDPGPVIAAAGAGLADAGDAAHDLARVLDAARQHLAPWALPVPTTPGGRRCRGPFPSAVDAWLR